MKSPLLSTALFVLTVFADAQNSIVSERLTTSSSSNQAQTIFENVQLNSPSQDSKYPKSFESNSRAKTLYLKGGPLEDYRGLNEVFDLRDAYSKHFKTSENNFIAVISAGPQHYLKNGLWYTITNLIHETNINGFPYGNEDNTHHTYYGTNANSLFKINENGLDLVVLSNPSLDFIDNQNNIVKSIELLNFNSIQKITSDKIKYSNIAPGIHLEVIQNGGGFKYSFIVESQNALGTIPSEAKYLRISEKVNIGNGFKENSADGLISFVNGDKKLAIHNFALFDSKNTPSISSAKNVTFENGLLKYDIDLNWMLSQDQVFPIIIDPTVTIIPNSANLWTGTMDDDSGCDFSTDNDYNDMIRVGYDDGLTDDDYYRGFAKYNTTSIPDNACIQTAIPRLYQFNVRNGVANSHCTADDDVINYYFNTFNPASFDPVTGNCLQIFNAIDNGTVIQAYSVYGGSYPLGIANGWKAYPNISTQVAGTLVQNFVTIGLDWYGTHIDPGFQGCCFCTPDNDDWLDFRGWSSADRPQLVVTYQTPYTIGSSISLSNNNVCPGTPITLTLNGGTQGSDGTWMWTSGTCSGTSVGTSTNSNASITINAPATTTTYFVKGSGTCNTTACVSVTLNVLPISTPATSISGADTICIGSTTTLSTVGGSLGSAATWNWTTAACSTGVNAGNGNAISVSPTSTTTYFVYAQGTCNTTACVSKTVVVSTPTVGGSLTASHLSPCENSPFTISLSGQNGNVLSWERQLNGGGYTNIGNAGITTLNQNLPIGSYEYRALIKNGACNSIYSNTVTVQVIPLSQGGTTYAFNGNLCEGAGTLISLSGYVGSIQYWEQSINGGAYTNVGNAGNNNFGTGILSAGIYNYRAVIQSGACGSAISTVSTVTVSPATISGTTSIIPDSICIGSPLTVTLSGHTGSVINWERDINNSGYVNIGGNGSSTLNITPNASGLHTYRAIVQSGACSSAISIQDIVFVKPQGNASVLYNAASYCTNTTNPTPVIQTLGGTFSSSPAGLVFANSTTGQINLATSVAGNYTITYQLPSQYCNSTGTALVTINTTANATLNYSSSAYCSDGTNPTPTFSPSGGTFSSSPVGLQLGTNGNINLGLSAPGTYNITYNSGGACPSTATRTITINAAPTPTLSGQTIFCSNDGVAQVLANPSGGLYMGGAFITSSGQFSPTIAGAGVHMVIYQYTSPQGCLGYATTNITVNSAPSINITAPNATCDNNNTTVLNALPIGGTWSGPFVTGSGVFDPTQSGAGTFNLNYSVTDNNNCTTIAPTSITVNASPDASIQTPPVLCSAGSAVTLLGTTSGGIWSGGPYISSAGTFDPAISGAGTFNITHTVTSGICTSSVSQNIQVTASPNPNINPVAPVCDNASPIQIIPITNGGTFSGGAYVSSTGVFNPVLAGPGTHVVQYNVANGACNAMSNIQVIVNAAPVASFTALSSLCTSDPLTAIAASPAGGIYSGNPYITVGGQFDPNLSGAGIFPVIYTVSNAAGCIATTNSSIMVNLSPDATFNTPSAMCSSDGPSTFTPVSSGGTWSGGAYISAAGVFTPSIAGPGIHAVTYTVNNGTCSDTYTANISVSAAPAVSILSPSNLCLMDGTELLFASTPGGVWTGNSGYISAAGLFDPLIAGIGSHLVVYTVYGGNGCAGFDSLQVIVNPNPDATITYPGIICEGSGLYNMQATTSGGIWSGGPYINNGIFDPAVSGVGNHYIHYSVTNAFGCSSSSNITVTVDPLPVASFNNQNNGLLSYFTDMSSNATSWNWNFADGSAVDTTQNPTHQFPDNGTYFVRLIVSNDCGSDTIIHSVYVNKALSVNNENANQNISIYPNPTTDYINVSLENKEQGDIQLDIIDMTGKVISINKSMKTQDKMDWKLDVSGIAPGVYSLRIHSNGHVYQARFVKHQSY